MSETRERPRNSSAERVLAVLSMLGDADGDVGVTEVAAALSLDKSVVHRILWTLVHTEFAERDPITHKYRIGLRAWEIGKSFSRRISLEDLVVPLLSELVEETGGTGYVGALDETEIVYLAVVHGSGAFRVHVEVGARVAAHATALGRAIAANLAPSERERFIAATRRERPTDRALASTAELEHELDATRERGYAINRGESRRGVGAIGAAISNRQGRPVVAVSVGFPMLEEFEAMWDVLPAKVCQLVRAAERHPGILERGAD